jgi:uncharacterized phage-like protein YoqJ
MIVTFTGHRPHPKLGGYKIPNPVYDAVYDKTLKILKKLKPDSAITGMALGFDTLAAWICIELEIPYIAAVPFLGQEKVWPQKSRLQYNFLLKKASKVEYISEPGFSSKKMQIRNEWMVNNADIVIACYDGSKGGTANCFNYAKNKGKHIIRINPANNFHLTEINK